MEYPVSATPEEDIEKLADSVNLQRLSNSPAVFDHEQLAAMYRKIIKPAKTYRPDMQAHEAYRPFMEIFEEAYEANKGLMHRL